MIDISLSDLRSTGKSRISLNFVKKCILFLIFDVLIIENIFYTVRIICRPCRIVRASFYVIAHPLLTSIGPEQVAGSR